MTRILPCDKKMLMWQENYHFDKRISFANLYFLNMLLQIWQSIYIMSVQVHCNNCKNNKLELKKKFKHSFQSVRISFIILCDFSILLWKILPTFPTNIPPLWGPELRIWKMHSMGNKYCKRQHWRLYWVGFWENGTFGIGKIGFC